jgi:ribosomal protein S18 acetylase RimI-like enzyme
MKIVRLERETIQYTKQFHHIRLPKVRTDKLKQFIGNSNNICYFALDNEKVIGMGWGYVLERFDNENMLYIHSVDVLDDYQKQGVGTALIQTFLKYAEKHQFRNTFLITDKGNIPGNKLYQKFNHELEEEKHLYIFK